MSISKRDELLEKALQAFYRDGFYAVGMDKLAAETGVSKTSMYKHFGTKEELIEAVLDLSDEKFRNWLIRRIEELATETSNETRDEPHDETVDDPLAAGRLTAIFDALGEWFQEDDFRSCLSIRASSEYPDREHAVHKVSAEHKRLLLTYIIGLAHQAGAENPGALARQLMLLMDGAIVTAHLQGPKGVAEDAKTAAAALIDAAVGGIKA